MSACLRLGGLANGFGNLCLILVRLLSAPLGFMRTMLRLPSGLKALATSPSDDIFIAVTARSTSLIVQGREDGSGKTFEIWMVPTDLQRADLFTKSLGQEKHKIAVEMLFHSSD